RGECFTLRTHKLGVVSGHGLVARIVRQRPAVLCGGVMFRLSLRYFYDLGARIHPLLTIQEGQKIMEVWSILNDAERVLTELFSQPPNVVTQTFKTSWETGPALLSAIKRLVTQPDYNKTLDFMDVYSIAKATRDFEITFGGELHHSDAYFVVQKGGLDTL